jgi:DNA-directed RNA polymerase specialized sigma24 family protein
MFAGSNCSCLICQLEKSLSAELTESVSVERFQQFTSHSQLLSVLPTALDLVNHLHRHEEQDRNPSPDQVLLDLLNTTPNECAKGVWQALLLMVFIPTVHRTTTYVVTIFPCLARDDVAQHLIVVLLEFLGSRELRSRISHLAFAVARKLRRSAFRWAIRESRAAVPENLPELTTGRKGTPGNNNGFRPEILLDQFLDDCQSRGWLTPEERRLIVESKIEGVSCSEIAGRDGHSAIAIRHRVHRLISKLRRLAGISEITGSGQMYLFPR